MKSHESNHMLLWVVVAFAAGAIIMALFFYGSHLHSSQSHAGVLLSD